MNPTGHILDDGQTVDTVWKNTIMCANCGKGWAEHCKVHLIACCPGKCPKDTTE